MINKPSVTDSIAIFPSELGWMAVVGRGDAVRRLAFGYESPDEVLAALGTAKIEAARLGRWNPRLIARLQTYARGAKDDFRDVELDLGPRTEFQRRVVERCRRIGFGRTSTYAQLAADAGSPRAARAVGSVMATNPVPLIVPCHRVLAARGGLGGYSCPLGLEMKKRLLAIEAAAVARPGKRPARRRHAQAGA